MPLSCHLIGRADLQQDPCHSCDFADCTTARQLASAAVTMRSDEHASVKAFSAPYTHSGAPQDQAVHRLRAYLKAEAWQAHLMLRRASPRSFTKDIMASMMAMKPAKACSLPCAVKTGRPAGMHAHLGMQVV